MNMKKYIFITGLHRAGTHSYAQCKAKKLNLPYIEEAIITYDNWNEVMDLIDGFLPQVVDGRKVSVKNKILDNGFVLQCPGLAHRVLELKDLGIVYWMDRKSIDLVTSMKNINMRDMAWDLMKEFHTMFPNDPIWNKIIYEGHEDVFHGFVDYYSLLVKVKRYFYETKFKQYCQYKKLEEQQYYKEKSHNSFKKPLKPLDYDRAMKRLAEVI